MAKKTLVVYFSRTGKTREAAREVARALDADLEELKDPSARGGLFGYLRCSIEATFRQRAKLAPALHDPAQYDLVVIGTPVWNTQLSSPVRTYLAEVGKRIPRLAVLECLGGTGAKRTSHQIAALCDRAPVAEVALTDRDRSRGVDKTKLARFIDALRLALPSEAVPTARERVRVSEPARTSSASAPH
jgi:hypothetical protein